MVVCRSSARGLTAIEFALALPVLVFFILGAVDISRSMHAYSALQEGIRTGLRCTYTTDGDCVSAAAPQRQAYYHWNRVTGHDLASVNLELPTGAFHWIGAPRERSVVAEVLQSAHFLAPQNGYRFYEREYRAEQDAGVVVARALFPYVGGTDPRNPRFGLRNHPDPDSSGNNSYPAVRSWSAPNTSSYIIDATHDHITAEIDNVHIGPFQGFGSGSPRVAVETLCLESPDIDGPGPHLVTNFGGETCNLNFEKLRRVVVHVRGDASGSGHGKLGLVLNGDGVGGQSLDGNGGNFYPRGVPNGNYRAAALSQSEFHKYKSVSLVPNGSGGLKLTVEIQRQGSVVWPVTPTPTSAGTPTPTPTATPTHHENWDSTLSWRLTGVDIYLPDLGLQIVAKANAPCDNYEKLSRFNNNATCAHAAPLTGAAGIGEVTPRMNDSRVGAGSVTACGLTEAAAEASLNPPGDYVLEGTDVGTGACSPVPGTRQCPAIGQSFPGNSPNYGVAAEATIVAGGERQLPAGTAGAAAICPVPAGTTEGYWTVSTQPLPSNAAYDITQEDCSMPITVPSAASNYPHRIIERFVVERPGSANNIDPWTEPRFACAEFEKRSVEFDALKAPTAPGIYPEVAALPSHSPWRTEQMERAPSCENPALRSAAVAAFPGDRHPTLNPGSLYFTITEGHFRGVLNDQGTCSELQNDPCAVFNCEQAVLSTERVTTVPLLEGQTPPDCAASSGVTCQAEFSHFVGDNGSVTRNFEEAAREKAFAQIQSMYPQADFRCQGSSCVQVQFTETGANVQGTGSIEVPLSLLLGKKIEISFAEQREIEQQFAR